MPAEIVLRPRIDLLNDIEIIALAAKKKGIGFNGNSMGYSEKIGIYPLDEKTLTLLAKQGIKIQPRPDGVFTLLDGGEQKPAPGFIASNYWNFPSGYERAITLGVTFMVQKSRGGVLCSPTAHGNYVSPADHLPNWRMFKALVENDHLVPPLVKEIAHSEYPILIPWSELGLDGIRTVEELFSMATTGNPKTNWLGHNSMDMAPCPETNGHLFVTKPAQAILLQIWAEKIREFIADFADFAQKFS